jgi:hypothetical protein
MTTTLLPDALEARHFPTLGVAAGLQRAIAAARVIPSRPADVARLDGAGRGRSIVDQTFRARRLHVVRRDALYRTKGAVGPSVSA